MSKKILIMLSFVSFCFGDNFIIDTHSIRDFELLLKPNQTLMINHKSGKLIGILEQTPDGKMKRLPIPKKWFDKNGESAFKLKNYHDSSPRQAGGLDSMRIYETNADYKEAQEVRKLKQQENVKNPNKNSPNTPKVSNTNTPPTNQSAQNKSDKEISGAKNAASFQYENTVRPTSTHNNNAREWDKSKIIYEQKNHTIDLKR